MIKNNITETLFDFIGVIAVSDDPNNYEFHSGRTWWVWGQKTRQSRSDVPEWQVHSTVHVVWIWRSVDGYIRQLQWWRMARTGLAWRGNAGKTQPLQGPHNERDGVSNLWRHDCLFNRLSRRRWKKHQSSVSLAFAREIHRWPGKSPHKETITRKMFSFDDVIMKLHRTTTFHASITQRT